MNILIFDTETTSLDKPFCYNIGYCIVDTESHKVLVQKDYVIEQIWHNLPLFSTSYYAEKRPLYVSLMKAHKIKMSKFGQVMRTMRADIQNYEIEYAYAYNSSFDERVFNFNCDWYKIGNPFDNVKIIDIRPFAMRYLCDTPSYKALCEELNLFTETGNYSTTAEAVYKYISENEEFIEDHMALSDSLIEKDILLLCKVKGANITEPLTCAKSLERRVQKFLKIFKNKEVIAEFECEGYTVYKKKDEIRLKG